jgi:trigger factor
VQIRPEAERAVKRILAIDRIAETQSLVATEDENDARVEEIAAANETTPAKVYASMQKAGRLDALERDLTERKVFGFLMEQSEITS